MPSGPIVGIGIPEVIEVLVHVTDVAAGALISEYVVRGKQSVLKGLSRRFRRSKRPTLGQVRAAAAWALEREYGVVIAAGDEPHREIFESDRWVVVYRHGHQQFTVTCTYGDDDALTVDRTLVMPRNPTVGAAAHPEQ